MGFILSLIDQKVPKNSNQSRETVLQQNISNAANAMDGERIGSVSPYKAEHTRACSLSNIVCHFDPRPSKVNDIHVYS